MVARYHLRLSPRFGSALTLPVAYDAACAVAAFAAALLLRPETASALVPYATQNGVLLAATAVLIAIAAACGSAWTGLSRGLWRYTSLPDLVAILVTASVVVAALAVWRIGLGGPALVDTALLFVTWVLAVALLCGGRVAYRMYHQTAAWPWRRPDGAETPVHVAIIGADSDTDLLIRAINDQPTGRYRAIALLDERDRRTGRRMRGVPIVSSLSELDAIIARLDKAGSPLQHLIFDEDRSPLNEAQVDALIEWGAQHRVTLLRATDLETASTRGDRDIVTKPVRIEDLLGRPVTSLTTTNLSSELRGTTVLVTGGGGSIGSELCRSIVELEPKRLIVLDRSVRNLQQAERVLRTAASDATEIATIAGDIRDRDRLFATFEAEQPDFIFHAAALKHVPIVEVQPVAGMVTNVIGTTNVADAALHINARAMVMISTDKAVNPQSVMGATKRFAELYCQALDVKSQTRFVTVRFGNVLGSSGSVVPLFEQQIAAGGPVTVTHAEMTRYFMTISEASQLVLHAMDAALEADAQRGCIHVLDMGDPIQIVDLARKMILLSGHRPNVDIDIKIIGLRPGEKLFEELFSKDEGQVQTGRRGVLVGTPLQTRSRTVVGHIEALHRALDAGDMAASLTVLQEAVPESRLQVTPQTTGAAPAAEIIDLGARRETRIS